MSYLRCIVVYYLVILMCVYSSSKCNQTFQNALAKVSFDGTTFLQEHINGYLENRPIKKIIFKGSVPRLCEGSIAHMPELEEISLVGVGLVYLEPSHVQDVPNLKRLNIRFNPIYALKNRLFFRKKLITLDLSSNMIKQLAIWAFKEIDVNVLDLSSNRLVNISRFTFYEAKISELHLENNRIMQLDNNAFYMIRRVNKIYLNNNNIHHIEDYTFTNLGFIYLNLTGNDLTRINFLNNATLKHLDISLNKISYLSLDNSTSIKSMQISPNPWHCECLKNFWKYAEKHDINIIDGDIQYDTQPICIATSIECLDNYNYDEVRDLYFKKFSYLKFWKTEPTLSL